MKDFPLNYKWQRFPNGRKRREIRQLAGRSYDEPIGDSPLMNVTATIQEGNNDDQFDDQFEEDLLDSKDNHKHNDNKVSDEFDVSISRWLAYDALSSTLER